MSVILLSAIALIVLAVDILAPEVVAILAPGEYSEAMALVPVIAASVFFMFLYSYCSNIEFYFEKTGLAAMASTFAAVANVILNTIFIPIFGYRAAGYTTLTCYVALAVAHYVFSQQVSRVKIGTAVLDGRSIWGLALSFVAISLALPLLYSRPVIRYVVFAFVICVVIVFRTKIIHKIKEFVAL